MDDQETITETLSRELKEEVPSIGKFEVKHILNAYRLSHDLKDGNGLVLLFYKVETSLEKVEISTEHHNYLWVTKETLNDINTSLDTYIESGYFEAIKLALET